MLPILGTEPSDLIAIIDATLDYSAIVMGKINLHRLERTVG